MKKYLPFLLITLLACNRTENKLDDEVDRKITEIFSVNPTLWARTEAEFNLRISQMGLNENDESIEAFRNLILFVQDEGYPDNFFVDRTDEQTKELLYDLEQIEFLSGDKSAHRFLFNICNPIVERLNVDDPSNLISNFGRINPDSIPISFALTAAQMPTQPFRRPNLNDPGLRKLLTLFYFSEMIKEEDQ